MEYYNLVHNLKRIREDRNITYQTLERATGIPAARLREAEKGELRLSIGELDQLFAYYRMSVEQVLKYRQRKKRVILAAAAAFVVLAVSVITYGMLAGEPAGGAAAGQTAEETALAGGLDESGPSSEGAGLRSGTLQKEEDGETSEQADEAARTGKVNEAEADQTDGADRADEVGGAHHAGEADQADQSSEAGEDGWAATSGEAQGVQDQLGQNDAISEQDSGKQSGSAATADQRPAERPAEPGTDGVMPPQKDEAGAVFRIWGNISYAAAGIPELEGNDAAKVTHIIPIEGLTTKRPDWVEEIGKERLILNLGTADIWSNTAVEEWTRLQDEGYAVIGLGKMPGVYEPQIIDVNGSKVGFVSLAGLIHEANQIAARNRVGLPRAYDNSEVIQAVTKAKEQVDYLIVLIHMGNRRGGEAPVAKQERLAKAAAEAGADLIIGNRSLRSQEAALIHGVPVFYSLGRSVSADAADKLHNYVIDVHYADGLSKLVVHVGEMEGGFLRFREPADSVAAELAEKFAALQEAARLEIDDRR